MSGNRLSWIFCSRPLSNILRLMPYKINKNGKRAVIFYAGLIVVLNEVIEMFEENSNDKR